MYKNSAVSLGVKQMREKGHYQFDINIFCTTTIRKAFRIHTDLKRTVNLEIFARVLFSRNFAYAKFRKNEILTN